MNGTTCFLALAVVCAMTGLAVRPAAAQMVFVEAEAFEDLGGWVVDQQFMDVMGSPYVLAHGLGVPVKDAVTTVRFPAAGRYRLWVRTRDWVAPWKAPGAPGRFNVVIDGKPVKTVFGTEGSEWHWQDGGVVDIPGERVTVALHDLTGFEGRCDALLFVPAETDFAPPDQGRALEVLRRKLLNLPEKPEDGGDYDMVVVGGGIAGTCAAISAARLGLKTALIQDRPVIGGNNSSEVRVWLNGDINKPPYPRVGDVVRELEPRRRAHHGPGNTADIYEDERRAELLRSEKNLSVFLSWRANAVEVSGSRITAVTAQHIISARRLRFTGRWFADCTGHATVGALAGADFNMLPKGRMGASNLWSVVDTGQPQPFPRCPWAYDLSDKPFPGRHEPGDSGLAKLGVWYWESGFDRDPLLEGELIRDNNFRAMYGAWDALKNVDKKFPNHKLLWAAYIAGPRESRCLIGDIVLTGQDLISAKAYPDGCVPTGWDIDVHSPDPRYVKGFEDNPFISKANFRKYPRPYWIPYRCLYSRNITNLFMAGRNISVDQDALGAVRVMRTCGMMGEIVGMVASLCKKHNVDPRAVYEKHLAELQELMKKGVGKLPPAVGPAGTRPVLSPPAWLSEVGPNVAPAAKITVSSTLEPKYKPAAINDGKINLADNNARWVSARTMPQWVELAWNTPQTIAGARIVSGYLEGDGTIGAPASDFALQYDDGGTWKNVPGGAVSGNTKFDFAMRFEPVTCSRVRLLITAEPGDTARLWELEIYAAPAAGAARQQSR